MVRVLPWVLVLALWLYGLVDCAMSERRAVRGGVSKTAWFFIALIPAVGTALWFWLGRPRRSVPPASPTGRGRRPVAPDDDPDFLRGL